MSNRFFIIAGLFSILAITCRITEAADTFLMEGKKLTVRTQYLEMAIEGGAITSLKDVKTGEVFSSGSPWTHIAAMEGNKSLFRPAPDSVCTFRQISDTEGCLSYANLLSRKDGSVFTIDIRVNTESGEFELQAVAAAREAADVPVMVSIPVTNITGTSVILGSGGRYTRNDPPVNAACLRSANNLYSPPVAVVEGKASSIFLWSKDFFSNQNISLFHDKGKDGLSLSTGTVHSETENRNITGKDSYIRSTVSWRIGVVPDWTDAARRYRKSFEEKTGAKPLWDNPCPWVRKIHAVHTGAPGGVHGSPSAEAAEKYYRQLAETIDPAKLLLYYWNGNGIVLFGDPRYMTKLGWPKEDVVSALKKYGFHWIAYHPYTLIFSPNGCVSQLEKVRQQNWGLPEGYKFAPDYGGTPERFHDYLRPVSSGYYQPKDKTMDDMDGLWIAHPGSKIGREYVVRNFANYCAFHKADGCYLDILGADGEFHFPSGKKVQDGLDWRQGEAAFLREARQKHPELAMMSECQSQWTTPYTFFTHEGASHFNVPRAHPAIIAKLNHPFRTALWGSYTWTQEQDITPEESALVGCLPDLVDIHDEWSVARARLFAEEELFNDLPPGKWDPEAVAYYRGKGKRWFQYRKLPYGNGFVELTGNTYKPRLVRLNGVNSSPLTEPAHIQKWHAYRDDKPIGLSPDRGYSLIQGAPKETGFYRITDLPPDVFIKNFHDTKGWSLIELGMRDGKPVEGNVSLIFSQPCLRICDSGKDIAGPFETGGKISFTTKLPGGFVCVWQESAGKDGRFRGDFIAASGRNLVNGIPDEKWCFNSQIIRTAATINGKQEPTIAVGTGRYSGYAEEWIDVAGNAQPVLKFDIGYVLRPEVKNHTLRPLVCTVQVNGATVWREVAGVTRDWQPKEVSLAPFAGRKILVTFSAHNKEAADVQPSPSDAPVWFGGARVDNNPDPLALPDGSGLPRPAKILFEDKFPGSALNKEWHVHLSPANGPEGRITPEGSLLCFAGQHYKYAYLSRPLPAEAANISVQASLRVNPTGCNVSWNPGLGLYWGKGLYCFITGGNDSLVIRGCGSRTIALKGRRMSVNDDNRYDFRVKIQLTAAKITYSSSLDGRTWMVEAEAPRPKEMAAAPKILILGRGTEGAGECFQNDEKHMGGIVKNYMGDLVMGAE